MSDKLPGESDNAAKRRWFERPWIFFGVALVSVAGVATLVWAAQKFADRGQASGNWINGISACVAALNVLLTFYLLRTAQRQLQVLRDDLDSQQGRHDLEIQEQRERHDKDTRDKIREIENAQEQLRLQGEQLALARAETLQARQETIKTRLDLSAPRCSVELHEVATFLRDHSGQETLVSEDVQLSEDIERFAIVARVTFRVRNWGDEPVMYSTGSPISPTGSFLLHPGKSNMHSITTSMSTREWMQLSGGTIRSLPGMNPTKRGRTWCEVTIPVTNLSCDVNDTHTLGGHVMPITIQEFGVTVHESSRMRRSFQNVAILKRDYIPLRSGEVKIP